MYIYMSVVLDFKENVTSNRVSDNVYILILDIL